MRHRSNNLDALRFLGAALVMAGHAYVLMGRPNPPQMFGYAINSLGVVLFFSISGYLITASWQSGRGLAGYFTARALRIFPALIVVVLATAYVIGPLVTSISLHEYFASPLVNDYLKNIVLNVTHILPGVTDGLPYPGSINGSLWTLAMEFACYLAVPIACTGPAGVPLRAGLLVLCLWAGHLVHQTAWFFWGANMQSLTSFATFFVAGSLIREAQRVTGGKFLRGDVAAVLALVHLLVVGALPSMVTWVSWATLPYIVLTVGLASTPVLRRAARFGDFSYGLYLWAFPVQQIVIKQLGVQRMSVDLALVGATTLVLAYLSWHLVERPALSVKDRFRLTRPRAAAAR
jgi:peptidoglycan/LPS O-acetylase OafA/YrhL